MSGNENAAFLALCPVLLPVFMIVSKGKEEKDGYQKDRRIPEGTS